MRSPYELDYYFQSSHFLQRLDYIRGLGEGYDFAGAMFIVGQFELMQYHYGVIQHYLLTGTYDPSKENRHQIEIINYTNQELHNGDVSLNDLGLAEPLYGVHLVLPPGIRQKDIIDFVSDKVNFKAIKDNLDKAYEDEPGNKHAFKPAKRIDDHLAIVDRIDQVGSLETDLIADLSVEYNVDQSDIRKLYKRLGSQKNPFLKPV